MVCIVIKGVNSEQIRGQMHVNTSDNFGYCVSVHGYLYADLCSSSTLAAFPGNKFRRRTRRRKSGVFFFANAAAAE